MDGLPQDPFSGDEDDFFPMAKNARRMFEAAVLAGFTEAQAMEWMIRVTSSMINASIAAQQNKPLLLRCSSSLIYSGNWIFMPMPRNGAFFMPGNNVMEACGTF